MIWSGLTAVKKKGSVIVMVKRRREKMAPSIWIYPEIVAVCLGSQSVVAAKSVQALAIYTIYIYTYTLTHTHTHSFLGAMNYYFPFVLYSIFS
jgi:hypothetical protein